uniref:Vanadium-binding protein 3 n=1 Tax=Ascidia sydneiensis samea TaxID=79730 RepID=A7VMV5_ASCSS|nr:vanadium-binding protein 3 [Ascidia sydneiensis samea]
MASKLFLLLFLGMFVLIAASDESFDEEEDFEDEVMAQSYYPECDCRQECGTFRNCRATCRANCGDGRCRRECKRTKCINMKSQCRNCNGDCRERCRSKYCSKPCYKSLKVRKCVRCMVVSCHLRF